jgi:hypothetical protein
MDFMATKRDKPEAYRRFEELAKRVLTIQKKEVDQKEAERPKKKRRPSK